MNSIKVILENAIKGKNFKLSDMTAKVDRFYAEGRLSEGEREELKAMMAANLAPETEAPELLAAYKALLEKYAALEARVAALEGSGGQSGADPAEYPAWQPWDGVSNLYQQGAKVSHNGKRWVSIYAGQNTWEPGALGTASLWQEVTA